MCNFDKISLTPHTSEQNWIICPFETKKWRQKPHRECLSLPGEILWPSKIYKMDSLSTIKIKLIEQYDRSNVYVITLQKTHPLRMHLICCASALSWRKMLLALRHTMNVLHICDFGVIHQDNSSNERNFLLSHICMCISVLYCGVTCNAIGLE